MRTSDGAYILVANTSTIAYKVYNAAGTLTDSGSLTVASVVFDTLGTDSGWEQDSTGYNFKADLGVTGFAVPGNHRVEITFTFSSPSEVKTLVFDGVILSLLGS